jgi:hypothetical protein
MATASGRRTEGLSLPAAGGEILKAALEIRTRRTRGSFGQEKSRICQIVKHDWFQIMLIRNMIK